MTKKLCLVVFLFGLSNAAKILGIFPIHGKSHFFFHKGIMDSLVDAGHEVTLISPFPDSNRTPNYAYVDSNVVRNNSEDYSSGDYKSMSMLQFIYILGQIYEQYCHEIIQLEEVQNLLNSKTKIFDIMFVEMLPLYECFLPIAEKLGVPVIATFSMRPWLGIDSEFGNPHPLVIPSPLSSLPLRMTLTGRIYNALEEIYTRTLMIYIWQPLVKAVHQKYFPNFNLRRNQLSLLYTNNHAGIFSTPTAPNVIDVPGIHLKPIKPLPQILKIDELRTNQWQLAAEETYIMKMLISPPIRMQRIFYGVILFTFGSVTRSDLIEDDLREIFVETFANLPQRVIWKFEDPIENLSANVLRADWIPQRDILAHKNVKVFITHCGISGLYEAIDAGVLLILIPLFGDQLSNAAIFHEMEVGIHLNFKTLTEEVLSNAINEVLHNKKYAKQMQKLSQIFWNRPMLPQKSIVYWTEYVLRHNGTGHLKSTIVEIPFYQYFLFDIIAPVLIIILITIRITHHLCKLIYKSLQQNNFQEYKKS